MRRLPFIISVDDAGLRQPPEVERRCVEFFRAENVPASYFVIPFTSDRDRPLTADPDWVRRARSYEGDGSDYHLHGFRHDGFEFGAPESWMVQICGPQAVASEAAGFTDMRHLWTDTALRDKLERAIGAFADAFERPPAAFRAGCLAAGTDAFRIMPELGLRYDANKIVNPKAWDFIAGRFDSPRPWDPAVPPHPYHLTDQVVELPCMGEYAWQLDEDTAGRFVDLACDDLRRVAEADGVFMLMCHQQEVGGESPLARRTLQRILAEARDRYQAEFITIGTLIERIEAADIAVTDLPLPRGGGLQQ